jgi:hypothetical protein
MRIGKAQPSDFRAGLGLLVLFPIYLVLGGFLGRQYFAGRASGETVSLALLLSTPGFIAASWVWPRFVPVPISMALALGSWVLGIWMLMIL